MIDRRAVIAAAAAAPFLAATKAPLLSRLPGPPLHAAGIIARRPGGKTLRMVDGLTFAQGAAPRAFGPRDPFRVASVSKLVTAAGFADLALRAAVDLDADASGLLGAPLRHPDFPQTPITPRMLLSHTSGIRNGDDFPAPFGASLLDHMASAAALPAHGGQFSAPQSPPGHFGYCDVNFGLIAGIMERITGERFDRAMRRTLFAPLGLDCGYNWSGVSQRTRDRAAAGMRRFDGVWTPQVDASPPRAPEPAVYRGAGGAAYADHRYQPGENGMAFAPHGGLRLSLDDMHALALMLARDGAARGRRILAQGVVDALSTPAWTFDALRPNGDTEHGFFQRYGLGLHLPGLEAEPGDAFFGARSRDWLGHFGDAYGWMTGLFWNRRTGATLVYAVNGMPETDRPKAARSALTAPEEALIDIALDFIG